MKEVKACIVTEKEWKEYTEYHSDPLVISEEFFDNFGDGENYEKWIICYSEEDKEIKHFDAITYFGSPPTLYQVKKVLDTIFKDGDTPLTLKEIMAIGTKDPDMDPVKKEVEETDPDIFDIVVTVREGMTCFVSGVHPEIPEEYSKCKRILGEMGLPMSVVTIHKSLYLPETWLKGEILGEKNE